MGGFILLFLRVSHQQNTNETIDENHSTKHYFIFAISNALITFNSKTHQELVPVHIWFHLDKTHFISLLINLVPHHLNWWHNILFNMHETTIKPPLRIILPFRHFLFLGATHVWSLLWNARQTNTFSLSGIFFSSQSFLTLLLAIPILPCLTPSNGGFPFPGRRPMPEDVKAIR